MNKFLKHLNTLVHDDINLMYYEHGTDKQKYYFTCTVLMPQKSYYKTIV